MRRIVPLIILCLAINVIMIPKTVPSTSPVSSPNISLSNDRWTELGPKPIATWQDCCINGQPHPNWGSAPFSGRVTAIAVNASNTAIIYLGSSSGGVWKSIDGGATWVPISDDQPSLAIGSIAISADSKTLYVGTGDPNHSLDANPGAGLLKSSDEGRSWSVLGANTLTDSAISGILLFPGDPNRMIISTTWAKCCEGITITSPSQVGTFLSTDGGVSWQRTLGPVNATEDSVSSWDGVASLVAHPTDPSTAYAGDFAGNAWITVDKGASWTKILRPTSLTCLAQSISTDLGDIRGSGCRVTLDATPKLPNILFGAWSNSTSDFSGSLSYDTQSHIVTALYLPKPPPGDSRVCGDARQCGYDFYMKVDPSDANVMYLGMIDLYRSRDGGVTWKDIGGYSGGIHSDQHAFAFMPGSPSTIFIGNDGGIWKSNNQGDSWTNLNLGLGTVQFHKIAGSGNKITGGTQDNGCVAYSGSQSWTEYAATGDGAWTGVDPQNPSVVYCEIYELKYYKSADSGSSWVVDRRLSQADHDSLFFPPMAQDLNAPGTLYMGSVAIWKSTDEGVSWHSFTLPHDIIPTTAIAIAPSMAGVIYLGRLDGSVRVSMDGLATSQMILSPQQPAHRVISLVVDPSNPSIAYAALRGRESGMFKLANEAGSWTSSKLNGPTGQTVNVVKITPDSATILVGTDNRVYYSTDGGSTWNILGVGLPNVVVADMDVVTSTDGQTRTSKLIAGTYGRGAWSFDLGTSVIATTDFSLSSSPNTLSIGTGSSGRSTITVTTLQGQVGQVNLSVDNSACTITPKSISGSGTATLSCTFTTERTVTVTVTGTGASKSHTTMITLTIGGGGTGGGPKKNASLDPVQVTIGVGVLVLLANWIGGAILGASLAFKRRRQTRVANSILNQIRL